MGLHAKMNPGDLSKQMGHKNVKMLFEIYPKWIDKMANQPGGRQDTAACCAASSGEANQAF